MYYPAEKERLSAELAQVQAPAAKLKTINEQFQQVEKTRTSLATDNQGLKSQLGQSRQVVANYRRRIGALLGGLSDYDNDYLVVHAISSDADQLRISGRCMEPRLASGLAQRLASRLSELGLEIAPPTCEATYVQPNGAPFDFELTIRERPGGENAGASRQPPPATAQR